MAGKDGGQQLANAAKAAAASAMAPWIGTIILAVTLILIIIFAFAAATSLTKFGLIPPESGNAARAPGVGTGPGSSGRFNEQSKTKPCQDLYSRVAKYGVSMEYFYRAADKWQIPLSLLVAQAEAESAFNPNAYNPSGATGIIQILPGTWGGLYSKADGLPNDQRNAESSLYYGAKYMHQNYKQFGNWDLALAAYNAGPGNVQKYHGIPPFAETQNYVKKINANAQTYKDCLDKTPAGGTPSKVLTRFLPGTARPNIGTDFTNFRNLDLSKKDLSIVLHSTVTPPGTGVPAGFKGANPASISHFVIDGETKSQLLPLDKESRATPGLNDRSLSIEMVYTDPNTKQGAVLTTTADVVADLMARNNIPLSRIVAGSGALVAGPGTVNVNAIKANLSARKDLKDLGLIDTK